MVNAHGVMMSWILFLVEPSIDKSNIASLKPIDISLIRAVKYTVAKYKNAKVFSVVEDVSLLKRAKSQHGIN